MYKQLLKVFVILVALFSIWVSYLGYEQGNALDKLSDDYISQIKSRIKEKTRSYLLPAQTIARVGSELVSRDILSMDRPNTLSTFVQPFVDSFPQLRGYFVGKETNEFWFWANQYSGEYSHRIEEIKYDEQGRLTDKYYFYHDFDSPYDKAVDSTTGFDTITRPWYVGAKTLGGAYWTDVYVFSLVDKVALTGVTASYPVFQPDGQLFGVFGVDILLSELSEFLAEEAHGYDGQLVIFNENKEVIAYSKHLKLPVAKQVSLLSDIDNPVLQQAWSDYQQHGFSEFFFKHHNERYLASYTPFLLNDEKDWYLLLLLPESQLTQDAGSNMRLVSIIATFVFILCLFVLFKLFSRPVSTAIKALVNK